MRILIIEDELKLATVLREGLEGYGMKVSVALDGNSALAQVQEQSFDILLLDINLPDMQGTEVCRQLRAMRIATPVIMLTALGTTTDKLEGFDAGADDYLVKPFDFGELLARIRAVSKRIQSNQTPGAVLRIADLEIDVDAHEVHRGGQRITLTAKEFSLIEYLVRNKGRVLPRAEIAAKVWDLHFDRGTNVIDVYINSLRKKLDKNFGTKLIHTVTGVGFVVREETPQLA
jgi:DNA-binding response OmpR family regulator